MEEVPLILQYMSFILSGMVLLMVAGAIIWAFIFFVLEVIPDSIRYLKRKFYR